jgi:hypothetical protein
MIPAFLKENQNEKKKCFSWKKEIIYAYIKRRDLIFSEILIKK